MLRQLRRLWVPERLRIYIAALVLASSALFASMDVRAGAAQQPSPSVGGAVGGTTFTRYSPFDAEITAFYRARADRLVWSDKGTLNADGRLLLAALLRSHEHGIDLIDDIGPWRYAAGANLSASEALGYDKWLTELFLRYCRVLRTGRLSPRDAGMTWAIEGPSFDAAQLLLSLDGGVLSTILGEQAPPHAEYKQLASALAVYRDIQARGGWPLVPDGSVLGQGRHDQRVSDLRRRLALEGYTASSQGDQETFFDAQLEQAVKIFQQAHGLARDGRVGRETLAALNVSAEKRTEQIQLNMDRWRWMPRELPTRRIDVNAAAAWLEFIDDDQVVLSMKTIVGSPRHPTPMLQAAIRAVIVNPVWNVPDSIARNEILPRLRRDPDFLLEQDMRILDRPSDPYGLQIDWKRVSGGTRLRLQQQPGPLNALGRLKFDMPNAFDVYLHDTPARALFERDARALSHGCVRLQFPGRLAGYLLNDPDERFSAKIGEVHPTRFELDQPMPVYLTYWTAFATADGPVQFRGDVYGLDARMQAWLRSRADVVLMSSVDPGGCPATRRLAG